jgi:uncharacterized protein with PQ loop repeat
MNMLLWSNGKAMDSKSFDGGSIFLIVCGMPQAWKSVHDGNSDGLTWGFLLIWFLGEIFGLIYSCSLYSIPLIVNYGINIIITGIMIWYKLCPRKGN